MVSYLALNFAISFFIPELWDRGLYQSMGLEALHTETGFLSHYLSPGVPVSTLK